MENASKALIMAGSMLIALIIISMLVIMFGHIGDAYIEEGESLTVEQLEEYNRRFAVYNNTKGLYGSELLSLANLIVDYDNRLLHGEDSTSTFYTDNKVEVTVYFCTDIIGVRDENTKKWIYTSWTENEATLEEFKNWYDNIEQTTATTTGENYANGKSLLTEIKSMPFVCITEDNIDEYRSEYRKIEPVQYNKYGRISKMCFVEIMDNDIGNTTYK